MSRLVNLSIILAIACIAAIAHGDGTAAKCAAAKQKAAVKKIGSKLKCYQKAAAAGVAVDPTCLTAAETKFAASIAKANAKGGCVVTGDQGPIETACDACVQSIVTLTPATTTLPPTCETGSAYPQCGGTCPSGKSCRPYIEVHDACGTTTCATDCRCVDDATLCGQACAETCVVNRTTQCQGGDVVNVSCCSGSDGPCNPVSGSPHCCCGSCVVQQGSADFCQQGPVCNATNDGMTCQ